jgi:hypothetical protein
VHSVLGKINHGGLKHNSLYLGLVLPFGGVGDTASFYFVPGKTQRLKVSQNQSLFGRKLIVAVSAK